MSFPILTYHNVWGEEIVPSRLSSNSYNVTKHTLQEHLDACLSIGKRFVTFRDYRQSVQLDEGLVAACFDDGTIDHYEIVLPLLERLSLHGIFFVSVGMIGSTGYLDKRHLREMSQLGHEIGSHGMTHRPLTKLSGEEIRRELEESKNKLSEITETAIESLSPPFGFYNSRIESIARSSGYAFVRTARWGTNRSVDNYRLETLIMRESISRERLVRLLQKRSFAGNLLRESAQQILGTKRYGAFRDLFLRITKRNYGPF
jgi:peptidoglycan/xylan/chitin deacetylase (PgdA/CDA1 family)